MEILFIWVGNYRGVFKNCEFNFGGRYRFSFDSSKNQITHEEDLNYQKDFFHQDVANISVVIGKNGTGKSFFLEMLMDVLALGTGNHNEDILIIGQDSKNNILLYANKSRIEKIKKCSSYKVLNVFPVDSSDEFLHSKEIIYYTNSFYDRCNHVDTSGIINISLKNLVFRKDSKVINPTEMNEAYLRNHDFAEQMRLLKIIKAARSGVLNLKLPRYLIVQFDNTAEYIFGSVQSIFKESQKEIANEVKLYFEKLSTNLKSRINNAERFKYLLQRNLIFHYLQNYQSNEDKYEKLKSALSNENLLEYLKEHDSKLFSLYEELTSLITTDNTGISGEKIWLDIEFLTLEKLNILLEKYFSTIDYNSNYLNFGFSHVLGETSDFSAGERAYLGMFARLYSLCKEEQAFANLQIEGSALLLIDEGELYFHPEWQKNFIQALIDFLPSTFPGVKLQVIITTHSPILLSDIPLNKVILLNKKDGVIVTQSSLHENKETFASNIYTLYKDNFFISDGLIGTFAENKINQVLGLLRKNIKSLKQEDIDFISKTVDIIGEPVIRHKLQQMMQDKLGANLFDLNERIRKLEDKSSKK